MENSIPVSKLGWETRYVVNLGFFGDHFSQTFPTQGHPAKNSCPFQKLFSAAFYEGSQKISYETLDSKVNYYSK